MSKFRIEISTQGVMDRFKPKYERAQKYLDSTVLQDCHDYVPMVTGTLVGSGIRGTKIGSGKIVYNESYAKSVYYARNRNFSKGQHSQACAQWFEKAKAVKKGEWINGVNKIIKGEG